jgi:hypothetical protein
LQNTFMNFPPRTPCIPAGHDLLMRTSRRAWCDSVSPTSMTELQRRCLAPLISSVPKESLLTDFGSEALCNGTNNNCVFREPRSSKKIGTIRRLTMSNKYFETLSIQIRSIPSTFAWNADETRVGCSKKTSPSEVIVAINRKPGSATIPEVRDDPQLTLFTAISAFRDSTRRLFISKLKALKKTFLAPKSCTQVMIM